MIVPDLDLSRKDASISSDVPSPGRGPADLPLRSALYMSENLIRGSEADWVAEIESVLVQSRRSNAQVGITGALLMTERSFVQVLEGPAPALAATLDRIRRDPRHRILRVEEGALPARRFGEWSMAYLPRPEADAAVLAPTRDFARGAVAEPVLLMMHYLLTEGTD